MHLTKIENDTNMFKIGCTLLDTKNNESYKYKSNTSLPNIICNQFNKTLITGISTTVGNESLITNSIKEKKINIKKKIGIGSDINHEYIGTLVDNKFKVFDALENLLINDDVNKENNVINDINNDNNSLINKLRKIKNNKSKSENKKKNISVPKLNFTKIYNEYNNRPLLIQEVKFVSKFSDDDCFNYNHQKIKIRKYSHHHLHHHKKSKNKRN